MTKTAVLAYSGGLDTTVAIAWLKENKGVDVIAVAVDVGQGSEMEAIGKKALESGAVESVVVDAVQEFADGYAAKALKANALYQQKYPLVSALSRPLIAKHLAVAARTHGAAFAAHGCTGKGNDQVRFEVALGAIAPDIEVYAPVREWGMTREDTIAYGVERDLPVSTGPASIYSIDENMWGRTIECGILEDPMVEAPDDIWERTRDPGVAPREPRYIEIDFEEGLPVALDGVSCSLASAVAQLDASTGEYGFGRVDMIEDRVVGIKSREVYECPGSLSLIKAHSDLEELTLDRELLRMKRRLEIKYAELVYEGLWFSALREALDAFIDTASSPVSGKVRLKLEGGSVRVVGRSSPASLYDAGLATYDSADTFDHSAGEGFVKLWGLPTKVWGSKQQRG